MRSLKILSVKKLLWLLANITMYLTLLAEQVNGRPQDILVETSKSVLMAFQQGAEVLGNGGLISKNHDLELPFAKALSKTEIGAGQAMIRRDNSESSEEEDYRKRRKRSMTELIGEESLLASPFHYIHHILKRSPCHLGGGGTTTGTDGGDEVIDVAERRRRARMRKAAADKQKKAKNSTRKTKKSKIVNDDDQTLTRRKRQSEQDDLNSGANNAGKDIAQHAQQFAEKIRSVWDGFINSINQMTEAIREKFSPKNPSATESI